MGRRGVPLALCCGLTRTFTLKLLTLRTMDLAIISHVPTQPTRKPQPPTPTPTHPPTPLPQDFINIELDNHRNQLIRLDLMLTALSASVALVTAVTSLFAMNVELAPGVDQGPYSTFLTVSISTAMAAIIMFISVIVYCRYMRLL